MVSCFFAMVMLCVLITTITITVSFIVPTWIFYPHLSGIGLLIKGKDTACTCKTLLSSCECGLWFYCKDIILARKCRSFFSDKFEIEKNLPGWYKAVQMLIGLAAFTSLIVLIFGLSSLCSRKKTHQTACALMVLCFLLLLFALSTFGALCLMNHDMKIVPRDKMDITFGSGFWIAVGASGMALFSSLLYSRLTYSDSERSR